MTVNTNTLVSITEANQNFSKVARLVDQNGSAVILKMKLSIILDTLTARIMKLSSDSQS